VLSQPQLTLGPSTFLLTKAFSQQATCLKYFLVEILFVIGLLYIQNSRYTFSPLEKNGVPRGRNAVEHSDSTAATDLLDQLSMKGLLLHKAVIFYLVKDFVPMSIGFSLLSLPSTRLVKGGSEIAPVMSSLRDLQVHRPRCCHFTEQDW